MELLVVSIDLLSGNDTAKNVVRDLWGGS